MLGLVPLLAGSLSAFAQPVLPSLVLTVPAELHAGEHATATLDVTLPPGAAIPLLITPFREGAAVEVVRGRLLRADGHPQANGALRFELPLLTHVPGSAVLGARLLAYVCEQRCTQVEVETRINALVLPARSGR